VNIFYFDECPVESAKAQPDKMLVKMPLESAQMLCTAHRALDGDDWADKMNMYKAAHLNHPCSKWVREASANYQWLYRHFVALSIEYSYRYGRSHLSYDKLATPLMQLPQNIPLKDMTPLAQAMPEEYKNEDATIAYRNYCINEKHYAKWEQNRPKPNWWTTQEAV